MSPFLLRLRIESKESRDRDRGSGGAGTAKHTPSHARGAPCWEHTILHALPVSCSAPDTPSNCLTPRGCPKTQLGADPLHPETASHPADGSVQRDHPDFRRQSRVQLPPVPRTDWLEAAGVCDLLLGLNGFARAAHRTQETLDCLVDWFFIKQYNPATARWQRCTGHRAGKGPRASEPTPRPSTCPPAWKPTTPALPGFYGGALD